MSITRFMNLGSKNSSSLQYLFSRSFQDPVFENQKASANSNELDQLNPEKKARRCGV